MKKKSKILMLFLTLISLACKSQEIKKIDILFVDSEIETPYRIKCDEFEKFFGTEIDSISIQDPKQIEAISDELNKLIIADKTTYSLPDTRVKLKLYYNQAILENCIDRFVVAKDGELFLYSKNLNALINNEIIKVKK